MIRLAWAFLAFSRALSASRAASAAKLVISVWATSSDWIKLAATFKGDCWILAVLMLLADPGVFVSFGRGVSSERWAAGVRGGDRTSGDETSIVAVSWAGFNDVWVGLCYSRSLQQVKSLLGSTYPSLSPNFDERKKIRLGPHARRSYILMIHSYIYDIVLVTHSKSDETLIIEK